MKTDNSKKRGLVWGGLLILFGILGLIELYTTFTIWSWVVVLGAIGLAVFGIFLLDRSDWGLLIITYVMWAIAGFLALLASDILPGGLIPTFVLTLIALPFLIGYLRDREQWGYLIPAYVLLAVGIMVLLLERGILHDLMIPAYVMFAVAIPFFVVYGTHTKRWWALIPGGIMAIVGLAFLLAEAMIGYVVPLILILGGSWILLRQFIHREPTADKPKSS